MFRRIIKWLRDLYYRINPPVEVEVVDDDYQCMDHEWEKDMTEGSYKWLECIHCGERKAVPIGADNHSTIQTI